MTTRLFLIRHGETEFNRKGLALGRADVPLNETGRRQAECLCIAFSSQSFDAIYSSPLVRASETAAAIASAHDHEVRTEEGLIEMDIGEVEGLTFAEVRERFPALAQNWGGADGPSFRMPGGERLIDVQARAVRSIEDLAARHAEEAICAVTHNFVILSFLASVLRIDLAHFRRLRHGVAAIAEIEMRPGGSRVVRLNDSCHLDGSR
jgi:broad specificity phosphatase PhoE